MCPGDSKVQSEPRTRELGWPLASFTTPHSLLPAGGGMIIQWGASSLLSSTLPPCSTVREGACQQQTRWVWSERISSPLVWIHKATFFYWFWRQEGKMNVIYGHLPPPNLSNSLPNPSFYPNKWMWVEKNTQPGHFKLWLQPEVGPQHGLAVSSIHTFCSVPKLPRPLQRPHSQLMTCFLFHWENSQWEERFLSLLSKFTNPLALKSMFPHTLLWAGLRPTPHIYTQFHPFLYILGHYACKHPPSLCIIVS